MYEEILDEKEATITKVVTELSIEINRNVDSLREMMKLTLANMSTGKKLLELSIEELGDFEYKILSKINRLPTDII